MHLSTAIMAHPSRSDMVTDLQSRLDQPTSVIWDTNGVETDTGAAAIAAHDSAATHHLVIQDDALPCADLIAGSLRLATARPHDIISLYLGRVRPSPRAVTKAVLQAEEMNAHWITHRHLLWGVGVILPVAHLSALLSSPHHQQYDRWISHYANRNRMTVSYPYPSPLDHRGDESLLAHSRIRRAHRHTTGSLLDQPINGPAVAI